MALEDLKRLLEGGDFLLSLSDALGVAISSGDGITDASGSQGLVVVVSSLQLLGDGGEGALGLVEVGLVTFWRRRANELRGCGLKLKTVIMQVHFHTRKGLYALPSTAHSNSDRSQYLLLNSQYY